MSAIPTICLLIGSCLMFNTFATDITNDLTSLKIGHSNRHQKQEFYNRFRHILHLYADIKELSNKF